MLLVVAHHFAASRFYALFFRLSMAIMQNMQHNFVSVFMLSTKKNMFFSVFRVRRNAEKLSDDKMFAFDCGKNG